jgi:hypothetical protein
LKLDRPTCHRIGKGFSWAASADQFTAGLAPIARQAEKTGFTQAPA